MKTPLLAPQHSKISGLFPPPFLLRMRQLCVNGREKEDVFVVNSHAA